MNKRLKEIRKQSQLRQCDVAKLLDICTATYNRYEKGVLNLDAVRLRQLADIYGVSVDYLLKRTDTPCVLDIANIKPEYIELLDKYSTLNEHSRGAIATLVEYEYQRRKG